ncbi:MAG: FAD-binding oxidoreductase [Chloroflexi bacterium]|nr:FAD-binding oxidoreductase [Chloroflexota bacterium]
MSRTADAVIVGGGIIGASTAHYLAKAGVRATLLERRAIAHGATGRSTAFVRMHYTVEVDARLAWASLPVWANWGDLIGGTCGFVNCGVLILAGHHQVTHLQKNVEMLQRIGIDTRTISPTEARELQPFLNVEDVGLAAVEPQSGYASPHDAAAGLARRAVELGATVQQGVEVTGLRLVAGRVEGVETTTGPISTPIVVLAAGAWTHTLARRAGIELPLRSWGIQIAQVRRPPSLAEPHMVILDRALSTVYRSDVGGITFVGARYCPWEVDPDTFRSTIWPDDEADAVERVIRRMPAMAAGVAMGGHAQADSYSLDSHAVVDRVAEVEGLYVASGCSGNGFKVAPALGMCLAELITEGQFRTVDLTPFRLSRFAEGKPLVGAYEYADERGSSRERAAPVFVV